MARSVLAGFPRPFLTALDALALVLRGRVKGKLMQLFTGELRALAAVLLAFAFATILDGAFRPPKGFFDCQTARAFHDLPPFALAAQKAASGFNHDWLLLAGECPPRCTVRVS